jgi:membrane protein DedA with SNARE-associated domain
MRPRRWFIWLVVAVLVASLAAAGSFARKTWRTYTLLEAARALQMPETAAVRGWMTLGYVATYYRVPLGDLLQRLDLPAATAATQTLRDSANDANLDAPAYVLKVQRAIAALTAAAPVATPPEDPAGWFGRLTDATYSALLVYGYPVLVAVLFFGALGLPVPAGPLTAIAGTLALQGEIDGAIAAGLAVIASVLGDVAGYGAGRLLSPAFLDRHGRWIGYTPANRERLQRLFARWGGLMLILTRSLTAHVGAIVSVLAGAGRYSIGRFLVYSLIGRLLWTASYFGLGYTVGTDFEAASGFLGYLSLLLIALAVAAASAGLLLHAVRGKPAAA